MLCEIYWIQKNRGFVVFVEKQEKSLVFTSSAFLVESAEILTPRLKIAFAIFNLLCQCQLCYFSFYSSVYASAAILQIGDIGYYPVDPTNSTANTVRLFTFSLTWS